MTSTIDNQMAGFRVTKYDSDIRLPNGALTRDEWTSVSDVGRAYRGRFLTCSEYLGVESAYIRALRGLLGASNVETLRITDLEMKAVNADTFPLELLEETLSNSESVKVDTEVRGPELDWVVRLALREAGIFVEIFDSPYHDEPIDD